MGNLLPAPVESVEFERHISEDIVATSAAMQGWRSDMEDQHTIRLRLPSHPNCALVCVFDGHAGICASEFLAVKLWREIDNMNNITQEKISEVLHQMDIHYSKLPSRLSGSTIVFAIIERPKPKTERYKIKIGWVGDSRAFAVKKGKLKELTRDHKPKDPKEKRRIELAGGHVSVDNRVDGELAMSRAFGDWTYKNVGKNYGNGKVVCIPSWQSVELEKGDCLLLSCDGLTEHLENKDIFTELLKQRGMNPHDPDVVLNGLLQKALKSGSRDNMTAVLVELREGASFQERERYRLRTVKPGPLIEQSENENFRKAYMKNLKMMGLLNCREVWEAASERDLRKIQEEFQEEPNRRVPDIVSLQPWLLPTQPTHSKDDELAQNVVSRNKYQNRKELVEKAVQELSKQDFESYAKPEVARYSAFEGTEFVLEPEHDGYIAFLSTKFDQQIDEKMTEEATE